MMILGRPFLLTELQRLRAGQRGKEPHYLMRLEWNRAGRYQTLFSQPQWPGPRRHYAKLWKTVPTAVPDLCGEFPASARYK